MAASDCKDKDIGPRFGLEFILIHDKDILQVVEMCVEARAGTTTFDEMPSPQLLSSMHPGVTCLLQPFRDFTAACSVMSAGRWYGKILFLLCLDVMNCTYRYKKPQPVEQHSPTKEQKDSCTISLVVFSTDAKTMETVDAAISSYNSQFASDPLNMSCIKRSTSEGSGVQFHTRNICFNNLRKLQMLLCVLFHVFI